MDDRDIDVSVLMIGIAAGARAKVQGAMRAIAERGDSSRPEGLVRMLREAVDVLRGVEREWILAGAQNHLPMRPAEAEPKFALAAHTARARFEHEVIRNYGGSTITEEAPEPQARSIEDAVVVVTIVVASRAELTDVANVRDRDELDRALSALASIDPRDFVAMEVIWSPADERETVSAEKIANKYPELVRIGAD